MYTYPHIYHIENCIHRSTIRVHVAELLLPTITDAELLQCMGPSEGSSYTWRFHQRNKPKTAIEIRNKGRAMV